MNLSSPYLVQLAAAAAFVLAGVYRYWGIRLYPIGLGYNLVSPDGRFQAYATTFYDVSFFGRRSAFYQFEVEDKTLVRRVICHQTAPIAQSVAHNLGADARIDWSTDSLRLKGRSRFGGTMGVRDPGRYRRSWP